MSACAKCGAADCEANELAQPFAKPSTVIACRDRELANLRSLLRSVTGKLEKAYDRLEFVSTLEVGPRQAHAEIEALLSDLDGLLEALS